MDKIKDVIFITSSTSPIVTVNAFFEENCIMNVEDFYSQAKLLETNHAIEEVYDLICKSISTIVNLKGVVINYDLAGFDCFSMVHHIRLSNLDNNSLNNIPIILTHTEELKVNKVMLSKNYNYSLFHNRFIGFEKIINLINNEIDADTGKIYLYYALGRLSANFEYHEYINKTKIIAEETTTRHQISNEWGALRLLRNAGYTDTDIDYQYPNTLYFKYLNKKFKTNEVTSEYRNSIITDNLLIDDKLNFSKHPYLKRKKILLIDDNAEKGWKDVLRLIFNCEITTITDLRKIEPDYQDYNQFDIIFLDLYMPNPSKKGIKDSDYSIKILKILKIANPQIPIIVFTASNKSWTLDEVTNLGADGMYVKESPEYAHDSEYTEKNFKSFYNTVNKTIEKYFILRPYWENILFILKSNAFNSIEEKQNTKFKDRLKERLEMFYGLLKRGFEQTEFNKVKFHFSDYELAFMTLWSALNEIIEMNFEKLAANPNPRLNLPHGISKHPDKVSIIEPLYNTEIWFIRNQPNDILFESIWSILRDNNGNLIEHIRGRMYKLSCSIVSHITYDQYRNNGSFFNLVDSDINPKKSIKMQIAFLILKLRSHQILNSQLYLDKLVSLTEIRNHLYLTHGDNISSSFYNYLEKEKRGDESTQPLHNICPDGDIKELFELVSFLLTGKDLTLIF